MTKASFYIKLTMTVEFGSLLIEALIRFMRHKIG